MKVNMLAVTYWGGKRLNPNDMLEVEDSTGQRWVKAGIAEKLISKPAKKADTEKE